MNETPEQTPSRRRGRPPKVVMAPSILAPPKEPAPFIQVVHDPGPSQQAPAVPSPLPDASNGGIDFREHPELLNILPGSDSKVRGASDSYLPVEVGTPGLANPTLPGSVLTPPPVAPPVAVSGWEPIQGGDVVQVNNNQNKLYGTLFTVGDVRNHKVHGYQISAGGKLEYFTVDEQECFKIGTGKVRSRNGCSAKWNAENR